MKNERQAVPRIAAQSWDTYWRGTGVAGDYSVGGVASAAARAFWLDLFGLARGRFDCPALLDIGSGNGTVVEVAFEVYGEHPVVITCLDVSKAAIGNIRRRFPTVNGVVSDACSIPFETGIFDLVTSQFGVEYGGPDAFQEAARMVAEGGVLAALLHCRDGVMHRESESGLDAISRVRASRFVPRAAEMFRAGFAAVRGASREPYDAAAAQLAPAVRELEMIMQKHGQHVAGDTVIRLYSDVADIHEGLPRYDPNEVLGWLARMDQELAAHEDRLASMLETVVDSDEFERIGSRLREGDWTVQVAGPLLGDGHEVPLAWKLVATR